MSRRSARRSFIRPARLLAAPAVALASTVVVPTATTHAVTTVTVTTVADTAPGACATSGTGPCTLREAVIYANAHPGTAISVPGGVFRLTLLGTGENDAAKGDLDIRADMTIHGAGANLTTVDGMSDDRVFDIFTTAGPNITVVLDGMKIRNGAARDAFGGGGIWSGSANVTLSNAVLDDNFTSSAHGGGIYSTGGPGGSELNLVNTIVSSNKLISSAPGGDVSGGGIYVENGTTRLTASTLLGNIAVGGPASAEHFEAGSGGGGGIAMVGGTASMVSSTVEFNIADGGPGDMAAASGGGSATGGGVLAAGTFTAVNSTFTTNLARGGDATVPGGQGGLGAGGAINSSGAVTLENVTIVRNAAIGGFGPGFARAFARGGGFDHASPAGLITNTIIAANTITPFSSTRGPDIGNIFQTGGHNLVGVHEPATGFVASDLIGSELSPLDPKVADVIAANGGPTETIALLSSSPAVNAGDNAACALPPPPAAGPNGAGNVDQRGTPRPQPSGGQCDIGAFELTFAPSTTALASSLNPSPVGAAVTFTATVTAAGPVPGTVTIRDGSKILGGGTPVGGVVTLATSGLSEGHHTITATYGGDTVFGASTASLDQVVGSGISGLQFYPLPKPVRLLDTRPDHAAHVAPGTPLVANQALALPGHFAVDGVTVPAEALALVGNATVDNSSGAPPGFATIYPTGAPLPLASNLNFVPGTIRPNQFTVGLGPDGQFNLLSNTGGHFVIDITGYYAPPAANGLYFHALPQPVRLLDTRPGASAFVHPDVALTAGQTLNLPGRFTHNAVTVPASAKALAGNATVDNTVNAPAGFATLFPGGTPLPPTSNLNFAAGTIAPNAFTVGLGDDGSFNLYSNTGGNFVLDVSGYYDDVPTGGLVFRPVAQPLRELDTRPGESASVHPNAPLSASGTLSLPGSFAFAGAVVPTSAAALVGNATVDNTVNAPAGFATLYPGGTALPLASNLNYSPGLVAPNAFIVGIGTDGNYNLFSQSGGNFIIDVSGYFSSA